MYYKTIVENGKTNLYIYSDAAKTIQVSKEFLTIDKEFELRYERALMAVKYIRSQTTPTQFAVIRNDLRNALLDYERGSDLIISWLKSENSAVYGNFTSTGFSPNGTYAGKAYYTLQRKTDLLNILE